MNREELKERIGAQWADMAEYCIEDILDAETEDEFLDEQAYIKEVLRTEAGHLLHLADAVNELEWEGMQ